ncbi:DHS-like NAD/FAD-binding domain-containing protein [Tothia fuscella]|uniref:DHS-like NAD/FAD-binding domain-containing protein n=1 Tax=Tothia fuscella TaxID=1048955 RepID=A0A9P4NWX2_9PEZI|nr:DHS-like NAD/FAD-binding domain-containing protein [Tothia fuscella]
MASEKSQEATSSSMPATGQLPHSFKNELRAQFFARDKREKPALDNLVPTSSNTNISSTIRLAPPEAFPAYVASSKRIICLTGAGLSASSGIQTFRDKNGKDRFWRDYQVSVLATAAFFKEDPVLSWLYHADRRREALNAEPNAGHEALKQLVERKGEGILVVNQNIDGLLERSGVREERIVRVHGSLFDMRCVDEGCGFVDRQNFAESIVEGLKNESGGNIGDVDTRLPDIAVADLPHCPKCNSLLRPGIVWFGEDLSASSLQKTNDFLEGELGNSAGNAEDTQSKRESASAGKDEKIDLMIIVGTSAMVWPAADFIHKARKNGAKIAVFDQVRPVGSDVLRDGDWFFQGDAAVTLPEMLTETVGEE